MSTEPHERDGVLDGLYLDTEAVVGLAIDGDLASARARSVAVLAAAARLAGVPGAGAAAARWRADHDLALGLRGIGAVSLDPWWSTPTTDEASPREAVTDAVGSAEWWWGIPPAAAELPCGGGVHHAEWRHGVLSLAEHLDEEAEQVLAVLGGTSCRCLDLGRAWVAHGADVRLLVVASRGEDDPAVLDRVVHDRSESTRLRTVRAFERHRHQLSDEPGQAEDPSLAAWRHRVGLHLLLSTAPALQRRLSAEVCWWVEKRWNEGRLLPDARPVAEAALVGRARLLIRTSLLRAQVATPETVPGLLVRCLPPGADAVIVATESAVGPTIEAALPFDWLRRAWATDAAVLPDGRLLLQPDQVEPDRVVAGDVVKWVTEPAGSGADHGKARVVPVVERWENDPSPQGDPPLRS